MTIVYEVPWPLHDALSAFLTYREPREAAEWRSSLVALLRDARGATGRELESGDIVADRAHHSSSWLGALAYLIFLEQVGDCFQPTDADQFGEDGITAALHYWTDALSEKEIQALYALRCCFAHDYGLVNHQARADRVHRFYLSVNDIDPVVTLPTTPWKGLGDSHGGATRVNLRGLGDLAESVYLRIRVAHTKHCLSVRLPGGIDELYTRYAFTTYPD